MSVHTVNAGRRQYRRRVAADEQAREVAAIYLAEITAGIAGTVPAIACRLGISRSTAYRRLERARQLGLIAAEGDQ